MDDTTREDGGESTEWHAASLPEVFEALSTDEAGLSSGEAARRLEANGPNELEDEDAVSPLSLFVSQFQDFLIYLLILAVALSLGVGLLPGRDPNYVDAGLILLILLGNGMFGFVQDYRAERSMAQLRAMATPTATVLRDGRKRTVDATEVVPGDVVVLEPGDAIPADARLLEANALATVESALTGESGNVPKGTAPVDADAPLAERSNMVYMATNAVAGRGRAVVVETGMSTEVGQIATQLQQAERGETPFQREVNALGRHVGYGVVGLIALIVVVQFTLTDAEALTVLLTAVTLAVAAVPEGLPAIVTLTLALGSQRMAARNALVRRLSVVESLGSVDVILTDKTGTLTENQMTVTRAAAGTVPHEVTGSGLETEGEFRRNGERVDPDALVPVLRCGAVCNNADVAAGGDDRDYYGDPTEVALLVSAAKAGVDADTERVRELPFSSDRRRMSVVVAEDEGHTVYTKGAPEVVLERCDSILEGGEVTSLTDEKREAVLATNRAFAEEALRVLGFARAEGVDPDAPDETLESGLTFLGLQGMIDPPRPEVRGAVADCRDAGVRVVMVTGDNLATARAVGERIGFDPEGAMTGSEVDDCDDPSFRDAVESVEVFARVSPAQKVRVLKALQAGGHVVAMTGDGVNDAPGLRSADVGVSMGVRGTDVAQSASDMVLQDDNFATIRDAVAEGRGIFDNIRKFVNLLLSANAGEVLTVLFGVLVGSLFFPDLFAGHAEALVLTPAMLLWINLVTDGLPALALSVDPKADDVLSRDPRRPDESVIDRRVGLSVLAIGATVTVAGLALFFETLGSSASLVEAQTLLFTFFVVAEMGIIQVIRRRFGQSALSNPWLVAAVAGSLALQLAVLYTPLAGVFDVVAFGLRDWSRIAVATAAVLVVNALLSRGLDRLA